MPCKSPSDFDVRSYGYNMLSKFLEEFEKIELVKKGNFVAVALREDRRQKADVDKDTPQIVKEYPVHPV